MRQLSNSYNLLPSLSYGLKISTLIHPGKEVNSSHPLTNHHISDDEVHPNLRVSMSKI